MGDDLRSWWSACSWGRGWWPCWGSGLDVSCHEDDLHRVMAVLAKESFGGSLLARVYAWHGMWWLDCSSRFYFVQMDCHCVMMDTLFPNSLSLDMHFLLFISQYTYNAAAAYFSLFPSRQFLLTTLPPS